MQKEPPVSIETLFDSESLQAHLFNLNDKNFNELTRTLREEITNSVRGVLFVNDSLVLVRDDGYAPRTNFVYGHEFGHWIIPWHKQMLYKCTQFDLCYNARIQMEREANFFAGELLFMGDKFSESLYYNELSIDSIKN